MLLMAPTGKAAHLINGSTIHSALRAPFNNLGDDYIPLGISTLNTARAKLGSVKFVIIDEISMVGNAMFSFVHRRLQDILGINQQFGGCHVLCVDDLHQLRPVTDRWLFLNSKKGKGPLTPNLCKNTEQVQPGLNSRPFIQKVTYCMCLRNTYITTHRHFRVKNKPATSSSPQTKEELA